MLTRYTRDENHQKIGMVVAIGRGKIGWSRCQFPDKFNKDLGFKIALGRAIRGSRKRIPDQLLRTIVDSYRAAELYYKENKNGKNENLNIK